MKQRFLLWDVYVLVEHNPTCFEWRGMWRCEKCGEVERDSEELMWHWCFNGSAIEIIGPKET